MAGYAKIWTDIENDEWFLSLNCLQRGAWLQLIVLTKNRGDSGEISFRSYRSAAESMGMDGGTCKKNLRKFGTDGKITLTDLDNGVVRVTLLNYEYHQRVRTPTQPQKKHTPTAGKSAENRQLSRAEQSRAEHTMLCAEIISDLNQQAGTKYKDTTEATRKLIRARLAEGFTVEDFKKVHKIKVAGWKGNPEYEKFLRPETLYRASHFESYLNEKIPKSKGTYTGW